MQHAPNVSPFGQMPNGQPVHRIALQNSGLRACILTYGAALQDLRLDGISHPLVLGWPTLDGYVNSSAYFGAIVGRFANRIGGACYEIDGQVHHTDANFRGKHTLHGGSAGSARQVWQIEAVSENAATLSLKMPDGHMGFAGHLTVRATYEIEADHTLRLSIDAECDRPTPCSFAPHSYFNLDGGESIAGHTLQIDAQHYLQVDDDLIPTGSLTPVMGSPLDFQTHRQIGTHAIDHNFCISEGRQALRPVASLCGPRSGLCLHLASTEPGLQVYSAAGLDEAGRIGLNGQPYGPFAGLALEPQNWPDAPNQPGFPSTILYPEERYRHDTTFQITRSGHGLL